ncbi:DNA-directed RNA polymerase subunit beta [Balamuthia mandrillaris]
MSLRKKALLQANSGVGCDVLGVRAKPNPHLVEFTVPHLESFNFAMEDGLLLAVSDMDPMELKLDKGGPEVKVWFNNIQVGNPSRQALDDRMYPSECREGSSTYGGPCFASLGYSVGGRTGELQRMLGRFPVMVKSKKCNLYGLSPAEMVKRHEEANELGGYFVVNGLEKIIRMLIMPRRNYVSSVERPSWMTKGANYTKYGTQIRCVKKDQSNVTLTLHYLSTGNCNIRFTIRKQEFFVPVIILLKALFETTDREIYDNIVRGDTENTFLSDRVEVMLREASLYENCHTKEQCLAFLGHSFRVVLRLPDRYSDVAVGEYLLQKYIFVHLPPEKNKNKFDLLIFMIRKLYALANNEVGPDNADSPMNQEILLGGHIYLMYLKEKLEEWLANLALNLLKDHRSNRKVDWSNPELYLKKAMDRCFDIGKKIEYFLSTGNLRSTTGLGLMQTTGFVVLAEKLNWLRYIALFRCVHRGAFFAEMKTTSVRKLMPEAWGFFCPVHTPDGAPCGLLNHLTHTCKVVTKQDRAAALPRLLTSLGMSPIRSSIVYPKDYIDVFLDGELLGFVAPQLITSLVDKLRYLKVKQNPDPYVPPMLEIGLVLPSMAPRTFPGLFLWTTASRMMRPVKYLATGDIEYIGSFEQVFMNIACMDKDREAEALRGKGEGMVFTHQEIRPIAYLSLVGSITPFSDMNQSPRNMYQCQMGKQSMATPCHSWRHRVDNKMYRLQTPQSPICRTDTYREYEVDNYPIGANAVVAVISYTGYDMEDAMIINKSAFERGFEHASVYKTEIVDLAERDRACKKFVGNPLQQKKNANGEVITERFCPALDDDGLPHVGQRLHKDDPYYCIVDSTTGEAFVKKFKDKEEAYVDEVRVIGTSAEGIQHFSIKCRYNRNPIIGDKFASRHGQKGVMSQLWPMVDMPFSESGLTPDVIINPHAFPSRMTIGMLVESMASKSGSLHGIFQNATPFRFNEKDTALHYFGEQLLKAGFNYYGNEPMYSGIFGTELRADIYLGVVYYQRLRHMVSDKYQVRATGPVNNLTHQPIKGRKVGGGIRFGEMERDSLLAHGTSFLLNDRLMKCSDFSIGRVCTLCGSILSPSTRIKPGSHNIKQAYCTFCDSKKGIEVVAIPYVFRYLVVELAAMNIRVTLKVN